MVSKSHTLLGNDNAFIIPNFEIIDDCLGSFCDFHQRPPLCSPKSIRQVTYIEIFKSETRVDFDIIDFTIWKILLFRSF